MASNDGTINEKRTEKGMEEIVRGLLYDTVPAFEPHLATD
jgi:hypothetical protein